VSCSPVLLITVIFYNHPSTTSANLYFRTVPIISESNGLVAEVFVSHSEAVKQGQPIFRLDSTRHEAEAETARRKIVEIEAQMTVGRADIAAAEGKLNEARSAHQQALDELNTRRP
jgi:multidrug resistance efflux pump